MNNQRGEGGIEVLFVAALLVFCVGAAGVAIVKDVKANKAKHEARLQHLSHFQKKPETIVKLKPIKTAAVNRQGKPVWLGRYAFKRSVPVSNTAKTKTIWYEYNFYMPDDSYSRYGNNVPYGGTWINNAKAPEQEEVAEEGQMNVEEMADDESEPSTDADADSAAEGDGGADSGGDSGDSGGDGGGDSGGGDGGGGDGGGGGGD